MKNLKTKLEFEFEEIDDIPELNFELKLKPKAKNTIKIIKKRKSKRDRNTGLF
jgi:hypothetical protein